MVIDLVMVTVPKPPGSRQLISPAVAVLEIAPAQVLHGAVRLQGLASSPTPETQVLVACADAVPHERQRIRAVRTEANPPEVAFIPYPHLDELIICRHPSATPVARPPNC